MQEIVPRESRRHVPMLAQRRPFDHRLFANRLGLGLAFFLAALPAKSDPFASAWSEGKAQMRLIAAGKGADGNYEAAAEIRLPATAITYWRTPGDAGVPPKFSMDGSENVAKAEVLFPAPQRIDDQGVEAFGYRGSVVFPIHVAARNQRAPVLLHLTVDYAVCDNICLPEKSSAELALPAAGQSQQASLIAGAEARVPIALSPQDVAARISVVLDGAAARPTWLLAWKGDSAPADLFAEAPEGWAFETQRRADRLFSITAVEAPAAARHVAVQMTLSGTPTAYAFTTELMLPAPAPSGEQTTQAVPAAGTK